MKILIAIDGSDRSDSVIDACKNFVKSAKEIKVISVIEPHYMVGAEPFAVSAEFYAEMEKNERKLAEDKVKAAEDSLNGFFANDKAVIVSEILFGNPGQKIVEETENWQADLVIVGSHGYGFWQRAMLGSVSDSVIHHAKCSVLVVKKP